MTLRSGLRIRKNSPAREEAAADKGAPKSEAAQLAACV